MRRSPQVAHRRTPSPRGIKGVRRAPLPAGPTLQLATLVGAPPEGDEWLHEIKYDGYRIACRLERGRARLLTRKGSDWTTRFASVAGALDHLPVRSALLDGEVVVLLPDGTTSFNALQNALSAAHPVDLAYFVFDLLHLDGYDLTRVALEERKRLLRDLLAASDARATCRYSDHVRGGGAEFFRRACELRVEGILSKRRDAPYVAGRSRTWLKTKCIREQEFVVGGFTEPSGRRSGIGALMVGVYENGHLAYAGKVGTGFTEAVARDLRQRLDSLATSTCPFEKRPPASLHAHWSKPKLVVQVAFTEWTPDGRLRHPSFKGVREDKAPSDVVREEPAAPPVPKASRRRGTRTLPPRIT